MSLVSLVTWRFTYKMSNILAKRFAPQQICLESRGDFNEILLRTELP